ncbi:TIGR03854 family LLM class F420-dependent oxidoreductase, partial [Mycobacterium avium]|uniref:TIGR03854 family LLM class F420-dependent oxidoreductase n=1 Tax=Mycobacterium avium TaxID=1764 RepID=UPI001F2AE7A4
MKIRFGVGLGADNAPAELGAIVDHLESTGVDSLWFSELVYSPAVDPVVGMAFALARTHRLKVGTSVAVLPGRHPVLVAKQLASLAAVAPKRVLPVFGLRSAIPAEREVFVVPDGERAAVFDESLRLLRAALVEDSATFTGRYFSVTGAAVPPKPAPPPGILPGRSAPAALRRIGRLSRCLVGESPTPAAGRRPRRCGGTGRWPTAGRAGSSPRRWAGAGARRTRGSRRAPRGPSDPDTAGVCWTARAGGRRRRA